MGTYQRIRIIQHILTVFDIVTVTGAVVNMFIIVRPQPWRPACSRDCPAVQDWRVQVQRVRQGVDQEVRHVGAQGPDPAFQQHYLDSNLPIISSSNRTKQSETNIERILSSEILIIITVNLVLSP